MCSTLNSMGRVRLMPWFMLDFKNSSRSRNQIFTRNFKEKYHLNDELTYKNGVFPISTVLQQSEIILLDQKSKVVLTTSKRYSINK